MRIIGIDPGIAIVGYGIVDYQRNHFETVAYGAIETKANLPFSYRLKSIYEELHQIFDKYQPDHCAVEELFFNKNVTTAISVGHGRGVILLASEIRGIPLYEYTPLQVKQGVVGYGRAEKKQVQEMVRLILKLSSCPKPDDVADALAVAICHAHAGKFDTLFKLK